MRFLEPNVRSFPMNPLPPIPPDRITVSADELERAIGVWLKVMPAHLWRAYLAMLEIDPRRRTEADRVDPRNVMAGYLAECFNRARWTASHEERAKPPG